MPKAIVVHEWVKDPLDLKCEEIAPFQPRKGQVILDVKAAGLNFPDTLIIQGKYQFQPNFPYSPGGEVAGVIKSIGDGVTKFKVGDRCIAMTGWGGFSEECVIDDFKLIKLPPAMDFNTGAGFCMTYGTSLYALKDRADLLPGQTILVLGAAGGVGLTAVELAKVMGAKVIAAASTQDKLATCKAYGADFLINYTTENLKEKVMEYTNGNGVDVIYDPVGGTELPNLAIRSMAWEGKYLVIGFAAGAIPKLPLNLTLLKGCSIVGVFWGKFCAVQREDHVANMELLIKWHAEGKLRPLVTQTYRLQDATKALRDMMDRKVKGKAIIVTDSDSGGSKL